MKNRTIRVILILLYCIPYVFLAMNEDALRGTLWFYLVMILSFSVLSYFCAKIKSPHIVAVGNILSFVSSCLFAWFFKTEKWEWYFKPFLPNQLIIFESLIILIIHIVILFKKNKTQTN